MVVWTIVHQNLLPCVCLGSVPGLMNLDIRVEGLPSESPKFRATATSFEDEGRCKVVLMGGWRKN